MHAEFSMCRLVRIPAGSLAAVLLSLTSALQPLLLLTAALQPSLTAALQPSPCTRRTLTRRHGFFDVLSDAFANDETVSKLDYGDNAPAARPQAIEAAAAPP